jgi:hypothetical protein
MLAKGGVLELWLGPAPNKNWGVGKLPEKYNFLKEYRNSTMKTLSTIQLTIPTMFLWGPDSGK